jgi:excisionase family DNA binding protein
MADSGARRTQANDENERHTSRRRRPRALGKAPDQARCAERWPALRYHSVVTREAPEGGASPSRATEGPIMEKLLSDSQAAELLGTTVRFPRWLIAERRVRFIHVGRHVRIPLSALEELVRDGTVEPAGASTRPR